MAAVHWLQDVSGNFGVATDWSTGVVPGAGDDAILDAPGGMAYTVTANASEIVNSLQTASNAALTVGGGTTFTAIAGTGAGSNAGVINVNNAGQLVLGGTEVNSGQIVLKSAGNATKLVIEASGLTLSGHGVLNLTGNDDVVVGAAGATPTFTNVDNTIEGQGILGSGKLNLTNQATGVIDANGSARALTVNPKVLTNAGLVEATGAAGLILRSVHVNQASTGVLLAGNGAKIQLLDSGVQGGKLEATGTGLFQVTGALSVLHPGTGQITLMAPLQVLNGATLELKSAIVNKGSISLLATTGVTSVSIGPTGATLSGGGHVTLGNASLDRIYGVTSSATLTNVDNSIAGAGLLGDGTMTLVNDASGAIAGNSTGTLTIDTGANTIVNVGLIVSAAGGNVVVKSALSNNGTLSAAGGNLTLSGAVSGGGIANINGGTFDAASTFNENVSFKGPTGVFELAHSLSYTASVTGLSTAGTSSLDLLDVAFVSGKTTATFADNGHGTGGVLSVSNGTVTAKINLVGNYLGAVFKATSDSHGGTSVVDPPGSTQAFASAMSTFAADGGTADTGSSIAQPTSLAHTLVAHH